MSADAEREGLTRDLEEVVEETLRFFEGPGATSAKRIGEWGPLETLAHMVYWHDMSARGVESVAAGEGPVRIELKADDANARAVPEWSAKGMPQLIAEGRQMQQRLVAAAQRVPSLDTVVMVRPDGELSLRQRLTRMPRHWEEHRRDLE